MRSTRLKIPGNSGTKSNGTAIFEKFFMKILGISFRSDTWCNSALHYSSGVIDIVYNALCFSYFTSDALEFFLQAVCIDNEENIAPATDQLPGELKTKRSSSRKNKKMGSRNLVF